jgi:hypothetical protein
MRSSQKLLLAVALIGSVAFVFWILTPPERSLTTVSDEKAALRKVQQEFLKGNWQQAFELLAPFRERSFEEGSLGDDVNRLVVRVNKAMAKAGRAGELLEQGQKDVAARLMGEAAVEYPENKQLRFTADYYQGLVAFDLKDYDLYLNLAQESARKDPASGAAAVWLANALATKYAVTGESEYRDRAHEALAKAEQLGRSAAGPDNQSVEATLERIRHRLKTRQILSPEEYARVARPTP